MHRNSEFADLSAKCSISKQGHDMMLDAWIFDGFPQHSDQVSLGAAGAKFVDDVNVNRHLSCRSVCEFLGFWSRVSTNLEQHLLQFAVLFFKIKEQPGAFASSHSITQAQFRA